MFQSKLLLAIAAIVIVAVGGGLLIMQQTQTPQTTSETTQPTTYTETEETTSTTTLSTTTTTTSATTITHTETTATTTTTSEATTTTETTTAEAEGELVTFESAMEMVETISHMKYRMESSDGNWSTIEYTVLGEEQVSGKQTLKIELIFTSSDEPENPEKGTIWVSKDEGKVVKISIVANGETQTFEGPFAEQIGYQVMQLLYWPVAHVGTVKTLNLRITEVQVSAAGEVEVTSTPTTYDLGGKSVKAYSADWTYLGNDPDVPVKGHVVVAELLQYKWFVVELKETYKDGSWNMLKIEELSFS